MAFSWITAFKIIPWTDVLAAAPTVARTARDLWRGMSRSRAGEPAGNPADDATDGSAQTPEAELAALRAALDETRTQLLASSEVLRTLAEQDEKLIAAIEVLRMRTRVLAFVCVALVATCAVLLLR